jgi:anthranilate phosphoribosyltransferase
MLSLMRQIMGGAISPTMMAAIIAGLRVRKETVGELTAAAQVMREFATKVDIADSTHLGDIVGTGGDGAHSFNVSTTLSPLRRVPRSVNTAGVRSVANAAAPI